MSIISGNDFSIMEHVLRKCTKRSFNSTLKEWESRYEFNTVQKSGIEKIKNLRGIK